MKIRKGDKIYVIAGKYKNLSEPREVTAVFPKKGKVLIKDVNIVTRHVKKQ